MNPALPQDEQPLRAQIDEAQQKLGGLEQSLAAIDSELDAISARREQYALLAQACGSLEKLDELGVAELFWGDRVERSNAAAHLQQIRERLDAFHQHVGEIEGRRQSVVDEIHQGQDVLDILEADLYDVLEEEERRRQEWIVERDISPVPDRPQLMPWTRGGEDDQRFRKSLAAALLVGLLFGAVFPVIPLPLPEPMEINEVPERLARLIRQEQQRLAPPPPPVREEPVVEETPPEPEPEPVVAEEQPPVEVPAPVEEAPAPQVAQQEEPRQRAEQTGILAFRESFSNLAENRPSARLGADARISSPGDAAPGQPERSMVTTQAPGSSGGINLATLSRDVGGGGGGGEPIAGVELTRVASSIAGSGTPDRPLSGGPSAGRSDEEIQIVFDRYKAALYRLYNRELRNDPTLRGQMVLRVTIEPDGSVSLAQLQSTDMNAPELAQQVVERVRTFDFGAKDVPALTILYPIDFLPAI